MPAYDFAAFLTNFAPPQPGKLYGGGDNITAVGRGPAIPCYAGGTWASSDVTAPYVPVQSTADTMDTARAMQFLMWLGGSATGTGMTVVIEEQLATLPTYPPGPGYPPPAPTASGVYRPISTLVNFGDSPGAGGSWNVSGGWTADPLATGTVAGVNNVPGIAGTGTSGNGTGSAGSNGRLYTQCIGQIDPNVYSINYNVIRYTGGGAFYAFNVVAIPFISAGKQVGSPS